MSSKLDQQMRGSGDNHKKCRDKSENARKIKSKSIVSFASSDKLYHSDTLWKEDVAKNAKSKEMKFSTTDSTVTDTSCTLSATDESSVSSQKSLYDLLNTSFSEGTPSSDKMPIVIGHRGSIYTQPENTIASFLDAQEMGAYGVELDVFLTKCKTLVVFHGSGGDKNPGKLDSYCGVSGQIQDLTLEEARELSFSPHANVYPCPRERLTNATIPTLEEVLLTAKEKGFYVKIELKGKGTELPALELVEKLDMINQCSFASFYHDRIERIRALRPDTGADGRHVVCTGALYNRKVPEDFVQETKNVGATEVHLRYDTCSKDRVEAIHEAGMQSMAWFPGAATMRKEGVSYDDVGNEDEEMYRAVLNTGVGAMCVNRPNVLVNLNF